MFVCLLFNYNFFFIEVVKFFVEIFGRVYVSGGDFVDMYVGDNFIVILIIFVKINCIVKGIFKFKMIWKMNG